MSLIDVIEVGPRDGLQNQDAILSTADKLTFIRKLIAAGAQRMEVASFVNPARVPQMADAEGVIAGLTEAERKSFIGLVLNERGVERAIASGIGEAGVVAVASDTFGIRNQKQTSRQSVEMAKSVLRMAREGGCRAQTTIATAFGCPFEGEIDPDHVVWMAVEIAKENPLEIALADTIGVGVPAQVKHLATRLKVELPHIPLRFHFHNTRNTGLANAYAAVESGVTRLDASAGGIGGCPFAPAATGNIATEDLVYMLERSGYRTSYDLAKLSALAPWLAEKLGLAQLPAMVSRASAFPPAAASSAA
ncbi:MAG TPA: hydroxymethylglutaryl-CoA lyase [Rhizomicrobium sp.]|jgi:hydroxymethylglutaryl-CoA lyase|nr:hydroxymethylglutaryl-CoA lyase [Rhizomicrobium sp.]